MSIVLEPVPQPFYRAGDTVRGLVRLEVLASTTVVKDVQVKLRCDEHAAVAPDDDRRQSVIEFKAGVSKPLSNHERHLELTTNVYVADEVAGRRQALPRGTHEFTFAVLLPESVDLLPPHAPIEAASVLKVGVRWSIKAVAHRAGRLHTGVRAKAEIPVHPAPRIGGLGDLTRRAELSGQRALGRPRKWSHFGSVLGIASVEIYGTGAGSHRAVGQLELVVRLGYPEIGLPQGPVKPNFSLSVAAPAGPVTVTGISIYLVQRCLTSVHKKRVVVEPYRSMFELGSTAVRVAVGPTPVDLTQYVADYEIRDVFPEPFATPYNSISYELRVVVKCASDKDNKPDVVILEVPVNVLAPAQCWSSAFDGVYEPVAYVSTEDLDDSDTASVDESSSSDALPTYSQLILATDRVLDDAAWNDYKR